MLKYFSGTAIFTPFLSVIKLDLYLNDGELFGICWALTAKSASPSISYYYFVFPLPPVTLIFPVTKIYSSEESQKLDSNELAKNLISSSCE